jgi:SAM-dependent methyltransferase
MIQLSAAAHHRLLTGGLTVTDDAIETRGIAIAPDGLTGSLAFFLNGRPFDEVDFPIPDAVTTRRFAEISGAAGFAAHIRKDLAPLKAARFFRIDASPTGAYVEHDWRHAMWFMNPAHERFAFPPPANMRRVISDTDPVRFGMGGATIVHKVRAYLQEMGRDWSEFRKILDWGCGAGRISRYLISESSADVMGIDIDPDNVAWCRQNLAGAQFHHIPLAPPISLDDGLFDLAIGGSVMTHLTEDMQFAWLAELRRLTRPGAVVFLSIAGAVQFAYQGLPTSLYSKKEAVGFLDARRDTSLDDHIGDKTYYRSVWHSRRYVTSRWSRFLDVVAIVDGIAALQDFVVLRRRDE